MGIEKDNFNNYNRDKYNLEVINCWNLLDVFQFSVGFLLDRMQIDSVYIYGAGAMGKRLYIDIARHDNVKAFIDTDVNKQRKGMFGKQVLSIEEVPDDGIPIIVTPSYYFQDIALHLMKSGVNKSRILSLKFLVTLGVEYVARKKTIPIWDKEQHCMSKQFLITGAGFGNKGAQSMLMVATSEIRKRFKKATIYYLPTESPEYYLGETLSKYDFIFLLGGSRLDALTSELLLNMTAIVDVSGYALSSNWNCESYVQIMHIAKEYDIPLFLMPQSFGPFDFEEAKFAEICTLMKHPKIIYAREKESYELLHNGYQMKNVQLSADLVLQNRGVDFASVFCSGGQYERAIIEGIVGDNNVAIIPNVRNFSFGDKRSIMDMYGKIMQQLIEMNKQIYIIAHSNDGEACKEIINMFPSHQQVHYIERSMDCFEYEEIIKKFEFAIASRYHSIVHAYKQNVPCILIGWAKKYSELAAQMQQEEYIFDVRGELPMAQIELAISKMNRNLQTEKLKLQYNLERIQKENCFECLEVLFNKNEKK